MGTRNEDDKILHCSRDETSILKNDFDVPVVISAAQEASTGLVPRLIGTNEAFRLAAHTLPETLEQEQLPSSSEKFDPNLV